MGQVHPRNEVLDELLAELALHEAVGGDHPHEPRIPVGPVWVPREPVARDGELEEALGEGHRHGILPVTDLGVAPPVQGVHGLVADGDVGRIPDHRVVLLAEDVVQCLQVLGEEGVADAGPAGELVGAAAEVQLVEAPAVEQAVADGQVQAEGRGGLGADGGHAAHLQGRDEQPEAGDGDGEGVEIDPEDLVQCALGQGPRVAAGLAAHPGLEQAPEGPEQEVPGATGGVDQAHGGEAEGVDGRGEGAVEDEGLDEPGGLEQGVAAAGVLGEVLVEVAEEAGVPLGVGEVVDQGAGVRVHPLPEAQQGGGGVAAGAEGPERVVGGVEQGGSGGQGGDAPEAVQQIVPIRVGAPLGGLEVELVLVRGAPAALAGAGDQRGRDQPVVLQEADEAAAEDPGGPGLGDEALAPDLEGLAATPGVAGGAVLVAQRGVDLGHGSGAPAQVVLQPLELALQVVEQSLGVDHG